MPPAARANSRKARPLGRPGAACRRRGSRPPRRHLLPARRRNTRPAPRPWPAWTSSRRGRGTARRSGASPQYRRPRCVRRRPVRPVRVRTPRARDHASRGSETRPARARTARYMKPWSSKKNRRRLSSAFCGIPSQRRTPARSCRYGSGVNSQTRPMRVLLVLGTSRSGSKYSPVSFRLWPCEDRPVHFAERRQQRAPPLGETSVAHPVDLREPGERPGAHAAENTRHLAVAGVGACSPRLRRAATPAAPTPPAPSAGVPIRCRYSRRRWSMRAAPRRSVVRGRLRRRNRARSC